MKAKLINNRHQINDLLKPKSKAEILQSLNGINKKALNKMLIDAVYNDQKDIIKLLIEKGADINIKNKNNLTPLNLALKYIYFNNKDVINILRKYGAEE